MGKLDVGDHLKWSFEAGRVSGTFTKIHVKDFRNKGPTGLLSPAEPQYEIESDRFDHVAAHNALQKA